MLHHPIPAVAEYEGAPEHQHRSTFFESLTCLPAFIALSNSGRITRLDWIALCGPFWLYISGEPVVSVLGVTDRP